MSKLTTALVRLGAAVLGGTLAFAVWLVLLLSRMPRPPVPPSYAATMSAAVVVAAGFSIGMRLGERTTGCPRSRLWLMFSWCLAGCAAGASLMFPFGGMMAGFGLVGLGTATVLAWELRR
jgi:hypothetical protein